MNPTKFGNLSPEDAGVIFELWHNDVEIKYEVGAQNGPQPRTNVYISYQISISHCSNFSILSE